MLGIAALVTLAAAGGSGGDAALLARHVPELRYAAAERYRSTSVEAFRRAPELEAAVGGEDVAYGRVVAGGDGRTWLQYWLLSTYNSQDRGILRTGRHEGDWEFAQIGLRGGRPDAITLAQHSWSEGCPLDGEVPTLYVANGSHATYLTRGEHGRPWPDPDDEADGLGSRRRPRVRPFGPWVDERSRWGASKASPLNPAEQSSPRGPRYQGDARWDDPARYHREARSCGSGAPGRPLVLTTGAAGFAALALGGLLLAVRRRTRALRLRRAPSDP